MFIALVIAVIFNNAGSLLLKKYPSKQLRWEIGTNILIIATVILNLVSEIQQSLSFFAILLFLCLIPLVLLVRLQYKRIKAGE